MLEWNPPHAKWFVGGTLNASVNLRRSPCSRPAAQQGGDRLEGEPGDRRTLTYFDLCRQVSQFANVLKRLGVKRGDRVALYLPLVPGWQSRCWRARASARSIRSYSAASARNHFVIASTTPRRRTGDR